MSPISTSKMSNFRWVICALLFIAAAWSNMRYHFNEVEKKIEEEEIGRYEQYPIRLAWAISPSSAAWRGICY